MKKSNKVTALLLSIGMGLSASSAIAGGGGSSYCSSIGANSADDCLRIEQECLDNGGSYNSCSGLSMSRCLYLCS